jgi:hypothetical protein
VFKQPPQHPANPKIFLDDHRLDLQAVRRFREHDAALRHLLTTDRAQPRYDQSARLARRHLAPPSLLLTGNLPLGTRQQTNESPACDRRDYVFLSALVTPNGKTFGAGTQPGNDFTGAEFITIGRTGQSRPAGRTSFSNEGDKSSAQASLPRSSNPFTQRTACLSQR